MQKAVEIINNGLILRGTLHIPEKLKPAVSIHAGNTARPVEQGYNEEDLPMVIMLHGFAGNKTGPHFIFVKLSRILESMGIASLRFDFAGSGESDGSFTDMTLSGELSDANKILDFAQTLDFVDKKRISVVGLSMGGAVASMLAAGRREHVHSLCLWAPAGNMGEIVVKDFIGADYGEFEKKGYFDYEGLAAGRNFVEEAVRMDIYQRAADYDKDILLIHGDKDEVVALKASERYLEYYGAKARLKVVNGADHTFNKKDWEAQVLGATAEFLNSH